jgi:hypothetical protein
MCQKFFDLNLNLHQMDRVEAGAATESIFTWGTLNIELPEFSWGRAGGAIKEMKIF